MKNKFARTIAVALLALFPIQSSWATCGGGGGGGGGGMSAGGGGSDAPTYPVPWKIYTKDTPAKGGLVLFWFPASETEIDRKSTRLNSSHANISYAVFCLKKKK